MTGRHRGSSPRHPQGSDTDTQQRRKGKAMKEGDKVTVVNSFHAYCGRTGTVTEIGSDDEGDFIFVTIVDPTKQGWRASEDIMFEPSDIKVAK